MRRRFTADIELSEKDMRAFVEIVTANACAFTMTTVPLHGFEPRTNGHARTYRHKRKQSDQRYPKDMHVHIAHSDASAMTHQQRQTLNALLKLYGDKPFRKGDASRELAKSIGSGASSVLSWMCRHGVLEPVP